MLYKREKLTVRQLVIWWASAPIIYMLLLPLLLFDVLLETYHQICFRLYGIPLVNRKNYIVFDRRKLSYIPLWDKINCIYCSYANGFLGYARVIAARTEAYWCGIRNKGFQGYVEPEHHKEFTPYGDEKAYREKYIH